MHDLQMTRTNLQVCAPVRTGPCIPSSFAFARLLTKVSSNGRTLKNWDHLAEILKSPVIRLIDTGSLAAVDLSHERSWGVIKFFVGPGIIMVCAE